mmetsp:Transcript_39719/g.105861  ORF Transcript_39719/g.105861 Transcript_39719/m.105861 type:complete len:188 (+) Transcript_39719:475-1038(+)
MLASRTAHDCIEATDGSPERAARAHTLALARVVADAHRFAPLTTTFLSAPAPLSLDRLQHVSFLKRHHSSPYAPTFLGFSQIRLQHVSFLIGDLAGNAWIFFVALFLKRLLAAVVLNAAPQQSRSYFLCFTYAAFMGLTLFIWCPFSPRRSPWSPPASGWTLVSPSSCSDARRHTFASVHAHFQILD